MEYTHHTCVIGSKEPSIMQCHVMLFPVSNYVICIIKLCAKTTFEKVGNFMMR